MYLLICVCLCMCLYLQIQINQTGLRWRVSRMRCAHMFDGESTQVNQDTSCPSTVIHINQNTTVTLWEMPTIAEQTYSHFTYWLVRGCCSHWWEDQAGLAATGSPAYAGRSTSRWAQGSRWGGGLALGCLCPPWWQKSTFSHKTDLRGKPLQQELRVSVRSWGTYSSIELVPEWIFPKK